jgi:probable F420-dependent oxidoreductase
MRFGLALPQYDFSLPGSAGIDWPYVRDWAQQAEELGYDSVWLSDHLFLDVARYGGADRTLGAMECFTTLAALCPTTSRVRLGTLVVCNDLRPPTLVAKAAANIDVLSGGRLELGIGAGWYEREFRATGVPFERPGIRVRRLAEAVQIISGMLSNPSFSFTGRFYRVEDAWILPRPVQSPPTVWVGGKGDAVVSVAGRLAGGFNSVWAWTPDAFAGRVAILERAATEAGRDPRSVRRSVGLYALPGADDADVAARWDRYLEAFPAARFELARWRGDKLSGTPEEIADTVRAFAALGVEEIILGFGLLPFQIADASAVEFFAREVMPLARQR